MGGNALKTVPCIRVMTEVYEKIKSDCLSTLPFCKVIREMPEKVDYGDLDLLYSTSDFDNTFNIVEIITDFFHPLEIVRNGPITSFSYELEEGNFFQIDLIRVSNVPMALFYYSYGDVPVILGRILKKNNITFSDDGISVLYESKKIGLTNQPREICTFLGMDFDTWEKGFTRKEDVFAWICECQMFHTSMFQIDDFNHHYREIVKRRVFFRDFLEWIKNVPSSNPPFSKKDEVYYLSFFGKDAEKEKVDKFVVEQKIRQEKFNGRIFMKYVKPCEINKSKNEFENQVDNFMEYLIKNDTQSIEKDIEKFILRSG